MPAPQPPFRWKTWHKVTIGVVGATTLLGCGTAIVTLIPGRPERTVAAGATTLPVVTAATTAATASPSAPVPPGPASKAGPSPTALRTSPPVSYADCDAVIAAGAAPIRTGQPGFRKAFDTDGDGVGCEPADGVPATPSREPGPTDDGGLDPRFPNCAKARAAGYGPYHRGTDPEYDWYKDHDKDGVACD
ncbi:nuclease [Actinoplanes sp. SE50]|nr:nuclease [Actinoplanes sp. SE50/110]ATO84795.1 nuclease [Actinoplanes sp. SE50]SLM02205.1 nuclease [Actinoplanes sp. SE50/110]